MLNAAWMNLVQRTYVPHQVAADIPDPLLNDIAAAKMLAISPITLSTWRSTKRYPLAYLKIGGCVRYRQSDVLAFIASRLVTTATATR